MSLPFPPAAPSDRAEGVVRAWHAGWALGLGAVAGLLLLLARTPPTTGVLAGLAFAAAPAVLAAVVTIGEAALLGLWIICATAAVALSGGVAGPLAPLLAGPVLAAVATGSGRERVLAVVVGVGLGIVVAGLLAGPAPPTAAPPFASPAFPATPGLRAGVLLTTLLSAAFALTRAAEPPAAPTLQPAFEPAEHLRAALAEAQAGRAAAEANAEGRARFIAQMSHELRTPLNAIQGFSDIMRTRLFGPIPDRYGEYAELIHESGRHLTELINDVLDLSKIEADRYELRREVFDAREAVNDAMRLVRVQAEEAGVALRALLPTAPVVVDADHRAIKQMVLNLVSNALKFTPRGGSVDVVLREAAGALEIAVSDTGLGIAPEDLERLGKPYAQAQAGRDAPQGTGLGLSLVKAFAALHGGDLLLESRLGEGTSATVRLPVLATVEAAAQ